MWYAVPHICQDRALHSAKGRVAGLLKICFLQRLSFHRWEQVAKNPFPYHRRQVVYDIQHVLNMFRKLCTKCNSSVVKSIWG